MRLRKRTRALRRDTISITRSKCLRQSARERITSKRVLKHLHTAAAQHRRRCRLDTTAETLAEELLHVDCETHEVLWPCEEVPFVRVEQICHWNAVALELLDEIVYVLEK